MEQLIISELEKAASALMAPPQAITSEERHAAENVFLEFRKTKQPYSICRHILENCQVDYVLFESATTLKEAIIREWNLLQKQDIDSLCAFLLNYITQQKSLQKFVREQILQVVAMIFKRGALDKSKDGCGDLLNNVSHLLQTGDKDMQMICCSIMKALLTEYSSTAQSANLGLSLEYHAECKKGFENSNLLTIFLLCKNVLKNLADGDSGSFSRTDTALFIRYLSLAEQVLNWNFLSGNPFQLLRLSNETAKINLFRPPKSWQSTVVDPEFLSLFVKLYMRCMGHEELAHHSLQCLIQLASVTGPVFTSQQLRVAYLSCLIQGFSQLMNRSSWTPLDAFGYASVISRIVNVFPISVIASLSQDVLKSISEIMSSLACLFLELSLKKDEIELDSNQYEDAVDLLLDAWVVLVSDLSCFPDKFFVPHALQIFNVYLKTHLAPPDGIRVDDNDNSEIGEIDCDVEEDDRFAYSDELSDIGYLARMALPRVLPTLSTLLDARTQALITSMKHGNGHSINSLFEDIHWLLLIATNVLTVDCVNDKASVPLDILEYEVQCLKSGDVDVHASVDYISKLGKSCPSHKICGSILLITKILNLAEFICNVMKNGMEESLSPEIAGDVLWFLQCWSSSYLFIVKNDDAIIPDVFKSAFGESTPCGTFLIGVVLDIVETNLLHMQAEPSVAIDSVQVLIKMFLRDSRIKSAIEFPNLWRMAELQSKHSPQLEKLPVDAHRHLVEALIKAGSHVQDSDLREKFLTTLLGRFQTEYNSIKNYFNCDKMQQQDLAHQKMLSFLESLRGITLATDSRNVDLIFEFISPYLNDVTYLLEKYASCPDVVELILYLFVDVVKSEILYLQKEKSNALCGLCVQLIVTYSKHNLGRISALHSSEDESYQEILLLIRLLTHILSKDYVDFSDLDAENKGVVMLNAVDAVFHGLYIIIPLMTAELLKFPTLSLEYFKLVTFVCECYPERIEKLPESLFDTLMRSLEMALLHFGSDAAKNSYEALASIASHYYKVKSEGSSVAGHVDSSLKHFLKVVFELILGSNFDMDLLQTASETLFKLICIHHEEYVSLAQSLLAHQKDSTVAERLSTSFKELTPTSLKLSMDRTSVTAFRKNLEKFLLDIKGFLFVK